MKALFGTGLFSDVQINQVGSTLVVKVSEYKVVNQVLFQGNKKLKDNALQVAIQLKPRATFSQQALDADVEAVKAAYKRIRRCPSSSTWSAWCRAAQAISLATAMTICAFFDHFQSNDA